MPKTQKNLPSRAHIIHVLSAVLREGCSLETAFVQTLAENHSANPEIRHWVYEVLREWRALQTLTGWLLSAPLQKNESGKILSLLIALGLQQLRSQSLPNYVIVNETVEACLALQIGFAKKLVNALLQRYVREKDSLELRISQASLGVKYSHPDWLIEKIQADWGDQSENILLANQQHAPMHLRVNLQKTTRENYLQLLAENNIIGHVPPGIHGDLPSAITLEKPVRVHHLPKFNEGWVSVQDISPQWASHLLRPHLAPHTKLLDACAAPGNKTAHLLEIEPRLALTALDIKAKRLVTLTENLGRLGATATIKCAAAQDIATWSDGELFDVILLDAPCSGTGVIRRHPDSKWLRRHTDIAPLHALQRTLLENLWTVLKPDGILLYATCSILHSENDAIVGDFLAHHPEAESLAIDLPIDLSIEAAWGQATPYGRYMVSGENGNDGFFYAKLRKQNQNKTK